MDNVDTITAWLHLTDRCNLKCNYCHFSHNPIDMSIDISLSSIDSIFRVAKRYSSSKVYLKYMGGEPLLMFQNIIIISSHAKKLAKEHNIELKELIITNGILLDVNKIKTIKLLNINLVISLDGLQEYNKERSNIASTEKIIEAINLSIKHTLKLKISVVVSGHNIKGLPQFVDWLIEKELNFSINLVRNNTLYQTILLEGEMIEGILESLKKLEKAPNLNKINFKFDTIDPLNPHSKTCGAGVNYLVFNPNGEIAKCQMQMQNIVATHTDINPLKKIREDNKYVKSHNIDEVEECKTCEIRYFCTAGCPAHTHSVEGTYRKKSPNCTIYKAIYPHLLKLEALRLLPKY